MSSDPFGDLIERLEQAEAAIGELGRRINNMVREAKVTKVFVDGTAIVDAHGIESKRVPWVQRAGSIKDWDPPAVGERVLLVSPTGEPGRGVIFPGGYSNEFSQPHDTLGEAKRQVGDTSVLMKGDELVLTSETIRIVGKLVIEGESVRHNEKNIGDTHIHGGVVVGAQKTNVPAN